MLNPNKIRWMTRASIFEKEHGEEDLGRNAFFASDYVRYCLLKNFITITIAAILVIMLYLLCRVEYVLNLAAQMDLGPLIRRILIIYFIVVLVYTLIGGIYYIWQYKASKDRLKKYYRMLKLIEKYGQEDR